MEEERVSSYLPKTSKLLSDLTQRPVFWESMQWEVRLRKEAGVHYTLSRFGHHSLMNQKIFIQLILTSTVSQKVKCEGK